MLRLSLPRATNKEFVYEGNVIPKGTMVFLNSWACNMGESSSRGFHTSNKQ